VLEIVALEGSFKLVLGAGLVCLLAIMMLGMNELRGSLPAWSGRRSSRLT
jgi:hypothetical protein